MVLLVCFIFFSFVFVLHQSPPPYFWPLFWLPPFSLFFLFLAGSSSQMTKVLTAFQKVFFLLNDLHLILFHVNNVFLNVFGMCIRGTPTYLLHKFTKRFIFVNLSRNITNTTNNRKFWAPKTPNFCYLVWVSVFFFFFFKVFFLVWRHFLISIYCRGWVSFWC